MKTKLFLSLLLLIPAILFAQPKIVVAGSGNKQIHIIDKTSGQVEWNHSLEAGEECNSVAATPEGNILYSYKKGVKLISRTHAVLWDFKGGDKSEVQSACLLENGNFLIGICGHPARIIELDPAGNPVHELQIDLQIDNPHSQFRQIRKSKNGTYLLPTLATQQLLELSAEGDIINRFPIGAGAFSVTELTDDSLLLPCGDKHFFLCIDRKTGKTIRQVADEDIEGAQLLFVAQTLSLPNGNLLICNWDGHSKGDNSSIPQLIELDPDMQVVWTFTDKENVGKVSAAFYIEKQGF